MNDFFVQNKIITDKERDNVKQGVSPSANNIAERLNVQEFPERLVKEVNEVGNQPGESCCHLRVRR